MFSHKILRTCADVDNVQAYEMSFFVRFGVEIKESGESCKDGAREFWW